MVGDVDFIPLDRIEKAGQNIAAKTAAIIKSNLAMSQPVLEAGKGLRACGWAKFDWYDPNRVQIGALTEAAGEWAKANPRLVVDSMRKLCPEYAALSKADYQAVAKGVKISRDPERSNESARMAAIMKKFRDRAKQYGSRIKLIKADMAVLPSDQLDTRDAKYNKVAYLSGAKTVMQSAAFLPGPELDLYTTAERILGSINARLERKEGEIRVEDAADLVEGDDLSAEMVTYANSGLDAAWWRPKAFTRGICAAIEWAKADVESEKSEVYYVPRTIEIRTRIRTHILSSVPLEVKPRRTISDQIPEKYQLHEPVAAVESVVEVSESETEESESSEDEFEGMWAAVKSVEKKSKTVDDYKGWLSGLAMWQLVVMMQDNDLVAPSIASNDEKIRMAMKRSKIRDGDVSSETRAAIISDLSVRLHSNKAPFVAPEVEEVENGESLVV